MFNNFILKHKQALKTLEKELREWKKQTRRLRPVMFIQCGETTRLYTGSKYFHVKTKMLWEGKVYTTEWLAYKKFKNIGYSLTIFLIRDVRRAKYKLLQRLEEEYKLETDITQTG